MTDAAKDLIEKLLKQFDKANGKQVEQEPVIEKIEKKPHKSALVDDWSTMKPLKQHSNTDNKKNMKHVVTVKKNVYDSYSSQIQENPKTRFYITTEKGDTCYMFIVYKTGVDLKPVEGVTYWTVYPSYFENIAWIWKRGMLYETYNYGGDLRQFDKEQPRAGEILEMPDEDARQVLSLKDYKIYLDLKERKKNLK